MKEKENGPAPGARQESGAALDSDQGITFDMPTCGGCRTCEMACAFHHLGEFNPKASSLQVVDKKDGPGYSVRITAENGGLRLACDLCKGLVMPLCVEYCRELDDLYKILMTFEKKQEASKGASPEQGGNESTKP